MKSVMTSNELFAHVPRMTGERSSFDRSHGHKTCFNESYLVPFYVDEVLPGDTFKLNATIFARIATPIFPIMDNLFLDTFYFYVPNRIIWDNWPKFMGEKTNPVAGGRGYNLGTDYLTPTISSITVTQDDLGDHFGLPVRALRANEISALPFRAYNMVYNKFFRDENLIDEIPELKDDGPDQYANYVLRKRAKRPDYFTSALPWMQKGPGVQLPLGTSAPVMGNYMALGLSGTQNWGLGEASGANSPVLTNGYGSGIGDVVSITVPSGGAIKALGVTHDSSKSGLVADLSAAIGPTITSLREAFQLQRMYEKDARGGTRYTEILQNHFNVTSPDFRLQRPEYLGGSSGRINVNPVQKTSSTDSTSPQGNLAAYAQFSSGAGGFNKSFTEHGIIIGIVNVRGDITYQQGLNRMWTRRTRFDHYWPSFAHLSEQEILNKEIYYNGVDNEDNAIFGYQERYADYRYYPSKITGTFRSTATLTLDSWHLSEKFATRPNLNQTFIEDHTPLSRVVAVGNVANVPRIIFDSYINLICARPMPVRSVPGMVDHF